MLEFLLECLKVLVTPCLALALVILTKNNEKAVFTYEQIFNDKRNAFSNILSEIYNVINNLRASYTTDNKKDVLITETQCVGLEQKTMKEILYIPERARLVIEFITEIFRKYSTLNKSTSTSGAFEFSYGEFKLVEYLYHKLVSVFYIIIHDEKKRFINKKDISDNDLSAINFIKICYILKNNKHLGKKEIAEDFLEYDYEKYDINSVLENFDKNKNETITKLRMKLDKCNNISDISDNKRCIINELYECIKSL